MNFYFLSLVSVSGVTREYKNIRNAKLYSSFITEGYSYTQKEYNSISYLNLNSNENTIVSITKENSLSPMGSLIKYSCEVMSVCIHKSSN